MDPYRLSVTLNPARGEQERAQIEQVLEMLVRDNVAWLERQRAAGAYVPCCSVCAGIRYRPPGHAAYRAGRVTLMCAQDLLEQGEGDCGSIAALDAACFRFRGGRARARVTQGPYGPGSYHADVLTPSGVVDSTKEMEAA